MSNENVYELPSNVEPFYINAQSGHVRPSDIENILPSNSDYIRPIDYGYPQLIDGPEDNNVRVEPASAPNANPAFEQFDNPINTQQQRARMSVPQTQNKPADVPLCRHPMSCWPVMTVILFALVALGLVILGVNVHLQQESLVSQAEVEVVNEADVTLALLVEEMQALHAHTVQTTSRLNSLENFQSDINGRLNHAMSAIFVASSSVFGGHTYRLSRPMLRDISMHDHLCRLFGGYLVEIDSLAEHNFVQDFAMTGHGATEVAVGISDRDHEGNYTFISSGRQATTFKVGDGYNKDGDCTEMWTTFHGGYVDEPCYGPDTLARIVNQFVCEFTNNKV